VADDVKADAEVVVPLVEEHLVIARRLVETGRVRVHLSTATEDALVRETLRGERLEVGRIALGHEVATAPAVREEEDGAVLVVPVLEEILVVERRPVLKEGLRIRRIATTETVEETIPLRRQMASVERLSTAAPASSPEAQTRPEDGGGDPG
jgi:stress response protein YsnF